MLTLQVQDIVSISRISSFGLFEADCSGDNTTASLTLGGYDASKFTPENGTSFTFASNIGRQYVASLRSIVANNANQTKLLSESILALVDANVPHLWLPKSTCEHFEETFGLVYNDTLDRYLVNDTLHKQLKSDDVSVSFMLGNNTSAQSTVNITLPYSAFDLEIGPPWVNDTQKYFPIRRADNETQYTLGRMFLQEA